MSNNLTVEQCLQFRHIHPLHVQAKMMQLAIIGHTDITAKMSISYPHCRVSFSGDSRIGHFKTMKTVRKGIVTRDVVTGGSDGAQEKSPGNFPACKATFTYC